MNVSNRTVAYLMVIATISACSGPTVDSKITEEGPNHSTIRLKTKKVSEFLDKKNCLLNGRVPLSLLKTRLAEINDKILLLEESWDGGIFHSAGSRKVWAKIRVKNTFNRELAEITELSLFIDFVEQRFWPLGSSKPETLKSLPKRYQKIPLSQKINIDFAWEDHVVNIRCDTVGRDKPRREQFQELDSSKPLATREPGSISLRPNEFGSLSAQFKKPVDESNFINFRLSDSKRVQTLDSKEAVFILYIQNGSLHDEVRNLPNPKREYCEVQLDRRIWNDFAGLHNFLLGFGSDVKLSWYRDNGLIITFAHGPVYEMQCLPPFGGEILTYSDVQSATGGLIRLNRFVQ